MHLASVGLFCLDAPPAPPDLTDTIPVARHRVPRGNARVDTRPAGDTAS